MLLCSLLPHFWYNNASSLTMCYFLKHFEEFITQDASSWCVQINTTHVVFVCVCVCVLSVCVLYHMITHLVNNSAYIRICLTSITLCSIRTYIILLMNAVTAYAAVQHAEQINVLRTLMLGLLVCKWHTPHRVLDRCVQQLVAPIDQQTCEHVSPM